MRLRPAVGALFLAVILGGAPTPASTFVETFTGGSNEGDWTYGPPDTIEGSGGNPGAFLHAPLVDTFAPQPRTASGVASQFTGDYRAAGVTSVGVDLILFDVDFSADGRPLSVMLISDNGTAGDDSDDWAAYVVGTENIPVVGRGWRSYDFAVPAAATDFPPGWTSQPFGPNSPADPDWNQVITDVSQLVFFYGDPSFFYIFQQWDVGLDNPRIVKDSGAVDPGSIPPTMLLQRTSPTQVLLRWESSACAGAQDYGVFQGTLGNYTSHTRVVCTDTGADLRETIPLAAGNRYYLVVPLNATAEGSFGQDSTGAERPPATFGICRPEQALGCP